MGVAEKYGDRIECPACGCIIERGTEWDVFEGSSEVAEIDCHRCDRALTVTRLVSVSYRTRLQAPPAAG